MLPPDGLGAEGSDDVMTIGQFAQSTGLSAKALRLYDEMGLLIPAEVDAASGYRRYRSDQVRRGAQLAVMRRMGVPLQLAEQLLAEPDRADELLDGHSARVVERHIAERRAIASGRQLLAAYEQPVKLQRRRAAAQPWVGAVIHLSPDPSGGTSDEPNLGDDAANAAFAGIYGALAEAGVAVTGPWWTTLSVSDDEKSVQVTLCWPVAELPEGGFSVPGLQVETGVLPERTEALVQVLHADGSGDEDDQVMAGVPVAAVVHLEEQLVPGMEPVGSQVRQVGLLDADGTPIGVELVITTAIHRTV